MFLLDSLKEKIGSDGDESKGFPDMNYIVGNTSGLDIGQVPGPIDQRVGRMSQIGGSLMEIQITNPATFQIDRRELLNVINQIDIDITLHGDPNIGFTGAYATRGQGVTGYNIVHRYMKRYIEQMAAFKYEIDNSDQLDFEMGYVNMHASNEQIPAREERLASDVSVDPFGNQMRDVYDDDGSQEVNIYRNEEFMEDMFDYFFLEVNQNPWQLYRQQFVNTSETFREAWEDAQEEAADDFYNRTVNEDQDPDVRAAALVQTAARYDQGLETAFLEYSTDDGLDFTVRIPREVRDPDNPQQTKTEMTEQKIGTVSDLQNLGIFSSVGGLAQNISFIDRGVIQNRTQIEDVTAKDLQSNIGAIKNAIRNISDNLWSNDISVQAKLTALSNNADIEQTVIFQEAEDYAEDDAREAFAREDWETRKELLRKLFRGRAMSDELNKESNIFFHIMPAWMQNADQSYTNHSPKKGPKFIWDAIVGETFDSYEEYLEYLEESRENELNVIAAVGCCYLWGHWTQVKNNFDTQAFEGVLGDLDEPTLKEGGRYTWTEWMNKFGLKVNIEAMYGDPGQLVRVWRPKDIAVVCHAINQTAKRQSSSWSESYNGAIAKFTIDMEHTASFGVDPYQEIKELINQEKKLASDGLIEASPSKPLANVLKTYHLTKPGWEQQQGHRHGPFARGDVTLYEWLYKMVEAGFTQNPDDRAVVMFEVGGEYREEMYVIRVALDMIQQGISPEELDPSMVPIEGAYTEPEEALMARFFGMDQTKFNREWSKIEENAFNPLDGLLEAEQFDYTWSGQAAISKDNRPQEWGVEEYK